MKWSRGLGPYLLLGVLALGTALGAALAVSPAPQSSFTRLSSTQILPFNGIRLSPPPAGAKPLISASQAWTAAGHLPSGTFKIVLAEWHSTVPMYYSPFTKNPFLRGLVWVIEGNNVQVMSLGMGGGVHSEKAIWTVNASTGEAGPEYAY